MGTNVSTVKQYTLGFLYKSKDQQMADVDASVEKLRCTQNFIKQKISTMENCVQTFHAKAQEANAHGRRTQTISNLRLKKMYQQESMKLNAIVFSVETHILHLESVLVMIETVDTLKSTASDMQRANRSVDIEKLDDALENIMENKGHQEDIESLLAEFPNNQSSDYDDETLLAELENSIDTLSIGLQTL